MPYWVCSKGESIDGPLQFFLTIGLPYNFGRLIVYSMRFYTKGFQEIIHISYNAYRYKITPYARSLIVHSFFLNEY